MQLVMRLIFTLLLLFTIGPAAAKDFTWDKFGYVFSDGFYVPYSPLFSTPAALCSHLAPSHGSQTACQASIQRICQASQTTRTASPLILT